MQASAKTAFTAWAANAWKGISAKAPPLGEMLVRRAATMNARFTPRPSAAIAEAPKNPSFRPM
jgi:hypothetical protein